MVTKKNIYHYIFYVVYALIFLCSIGLYAINIANNTGTTSYLIPVVIKYAIVLLSILVIVFGYKLGIKYVPEKYTKFKLPVVSKTVELFLIIFSLIIALFIRFFEIINMAGVGVSSVYLDYALGKSDILPNSSLLSTFYGFIAKALVKINPSVYPLYGFNALLQIGIIFLTYIVLKKALRMRYALLALILMTFLPGSFKLVTVIGPDTLYTLFILLYVFGLVYVCNLNKAQKIDDNIHILYFIGLGLAGGIITSLDIFGIAMLLITVPSFFLISNNDSFMKIQKSWYQSLIFLGTYFIGAFAFLYVVPNGNVSGIDNVYGYLNSFIPDGLNITVTVPMNLCKEGIVLYILAGIGILAFIRNEYDKAMYFVVLSDIASIFTFVNFNNSEYTFLVNICFICISVIGFFAIPSFEETPEEEAENYEKEKLRAQKKMKREIERDKSRGQSNVSLISDKNDSVSLNNNYITEIKEESKEERAAEVEVPDYVKNIVSAKDNNSNNYNVVVENKPILIDTEELKLSADISAFDEPSDVIVRSINTLDVIEEVSEETNVEPEDKKEVFETVLPEPINTAAIIPSRREYKTAHVYKSEEEELSHKDKIKNNVYSIENQDAELKGKPSFIKNPLPVPKPHVSKEMNYDLITDDDSDYDITDISGKDYYDI